MPQGNFMAYQALKPVESKVGDVFGSFVDDYMKRGDAAKAAQAKLAQEQSKSLKDYLKDYKLEYKTTIAPLQQGYNDIVKQGMDAIGSSNMMADDTNIPIADRRNHALKAGQLANDILAAGTFFNDPELLKMYAENQKKIAQNKVFEGDSGNGFYTSLVAGKVKQRINNGRVEIGYVDNVNEENPSFTWVTIDEAKGKIMKPIEEDTTQDYIKKLVDIAQKVTTETTNSNGIVKTYVKKFDEKDGRNYLMASFGYDPAKNTAEQYNVNDIPAELNHLFYQKNKRNISNAEDFSSAIDYSLQIMKSTADEKTSSEVLKTAADLEQERLDIEGKKLSNAQKRYDLTHPKQSGNSGGGGGKTSAPTFSFIEGGSVINSSNNKAYDMHNGTIINLKNKEYIVGFKVPNKSGKGFHQEYAVLGNDKYGRMAYEKPTSKADAISRIQGYGVDPTAFIGRVDKSAPVKSTRRNDVTGEIKYDGSYRPREDTDEILNILTRQ